MTKKMVTPLLTVHKQSLPFRQVTSVTTPSMSTSLILWMCRIKGAQSLVTHGTSKRSFQPHHQHKSYVQQCMLRQDTLTVLQVQHILRDKTGGLRGQESQPKSLALHADHISVPFLCLHLVTSASNSSPVISVSLRNSCRRDPFIDIHYYSQCFFPFVME